MVKDALQVPVHGESIDPEGLERNRTLLSNQLV
jgi:hypothetical protein